MDLLSSLLTVPVLTNIVNNVNLLLYPISCDPILLLLINTFDFIIVGAGSAGAVIASRLSENSSVKVLLLEAGECQPITSYIPATSPYVLHTNADWGYKVMPQNNCFLSYPNQQPSYPQGKMFGGTSGLNVMMYIRGNRLNYDNWEAMGNPGWGWSSVLPYFLKAEANTITSQASDSQYHNTKGPLYVSEAPYQSPAILNFLQSGQQNGYSTLDVNGPNQTGFSANPFTMRNGERWSTFSAYLQSTNNRPNLYKLSGAYVTKVLLNDNNAAVGVQVTWRYVNRTFRASKEVIISAGAIGTPKILQLSGIGDPAELKKHNIPVKVALPGVGKNLHDHVGCPALMWKVNCTNCTYSYQNATSPYNILNYVTNRNGLLTIPYGSEGVAFLHTKYATPTQPDVELTFLPINLAATLPNLVSIFGTDMNIMQKYYGTFANSLTYSIFFEILYPKSRGTLTLKSSNPFDPPNIDFGYLSNEQDISALVEAMKLTLEIGNSEAFKAIGGELNPNVYPGCENIDPNSDEYYACYVRQFTWAVWHAAGSCKMGNSSDPMAVVDSQLKVYNVPGLRVADASIMPEVVAGNTNAPTIMIGEKASDMIKNQYGFL